MIRWSEEHHQIQAMVAEFSSKELAPQAARIDELAEFPRESLNQLGALGLLGAPIPEQYGGSDGDTLMAIVILEELATGCSSTAMVAAVHMLQAALPILNCGTDSQRNRYLPELVSGETLGTFALAEPQAEADAGAIACRATRDGDSWILDGVKKYVINGTQAGLYVVVARTGEEAHGTEGLTLFLVPGGASAEGVQIVGTEEMLGIRGSNVAEVAFEKCRLDSNALLGGKEKSFPAITRILECGRIAVAAIALGIARSAHEFALQYSGERTAFDQVIHRFEAIRNMFADAATSIEAGRLLTYRAACCRDAGQPFTREASMAKLFACKAAYDTTKNAVQILGGNGFSREYPVERMFRDAQTLEAFEATGELHRMLIARSVIGEPT
ncbi:MAG: acyl-CoA dehydrogenase family protein [Planctomycetota bacterium]